MISPVRFGSRLAFRRLLPIVVVALTACRGSVSDQPPVHIIPDMDWQPKLLQQGEANFSFLPDHRAARVPPDGTVARGSLHDNVAFEQGKIDGSYVNKIPVDVDEKLVRRGQQRFNIYCAACHDQTGGGNGMVFQHGFPVKPLSVYADHARGLSDGELFDIATNGVRNMPGYGPQVPTQDRWAIVAWVRVLQRSQHASYTDVPTEERTHIESQELAQ